jgi:predicted nucleic acid-binding Zn ribbon protein
MGVVMNEDTKRCVICNSLIRRDMNSVTCSRECFRKYQDIYNSIYRNIKRHFESKNGIKL